MAEQIIKGILAKAPEGYIKPSGKKIIRTTEELNVRDYATAQVYEPNLIPENIAKDVNVLGVVGTHEGGAGGIIPSGTIDITENGTYDVTNYEKVNVSVKSSSEGRLKKLLDATKSCSYLFRGFEGTSVEDLIKYDDTENVEKMQGMFYGCYNLTTIPLLDTSKVVGTNEMFSYCRQLTTIPLLDTSSVTKMELMFSTCEKLTEIPLLDTSNVTNMRNMFHSCKALTTIPLLDTSKVTTMQGMFDNCTSLTTIPQLDTSNVTNMDSMFYSCDTLTTIPQLDTSSVTNMGSMFYSCNTLTTIPQLDTSSVTNMGSMFRYCRELKTIKMYGMKVSFDISASTQFEASDLVLILNNLAIITSTQTLTMGATNLAKLSDEQKLIATNKGWTLA